MANQNGYANRFWTFDLILSFTKETVFIYAVFGCIRLV